MIENYAKQNKTHKYALIAGNAPSLKEIDCTRLPFCDTQKICENSQTIDMFSDFAIFRCNQFYFEEKYYLGKKVDYAFLSSSFIIENTFTYNALKYLEEYAINRIVNANIGFKHTYVFSSIMHIFPYIASGIESIEKLKDFFAFMQFNETYHYKRPTSGIYMCAYAVSLGYKNIYIAGIDFYEGQNYAFNSITPNIMYKNHNFGPVGIMHDKEFDIKALEFLAKHYGVNFYSICPNSPLSRYIPLAKTHNNASFIINDKPKGYIKDIIIPNNAVYYRLSNEITCKIKFSSPYDDKCIDEVARLKSNFKQNIIFKLFRDIFCLPSDLFRYLKGKKMKKKQNKTHKYALIAGNAPSLKEIDYTRLPFCDT